MVSLNKRSNSQKKYTHT